MKRNDTFIKGQKIQNLTTQSPRISGSPKPTASDGS